jgi:TorA maturation chaperone TorD
MASSENSDLCHHLEACYRLLSACLYQPSAEWDEAQLFSNLKAALRVVAPAVAGQADIMAESFGDQGEAGLAVVHARLFVGPFTLGAPPYGSCYLEPEKRVMGETTAAVRDYYLAAGLRLDEEFSELPDHMAVELEFLSYLLQRSLMALGEGDAASSSEWTGKRREFLRRFLGGWYDAFCDALCHSADNPFYLALADCLRGVLQRDLLLLGLTASGDQARP